MDAPTDILVGTMASHWFVDGPAGRIYIPRDGRWSYNVDARRPTFAPSVRESEWGPDPERTQEDYLADVWKYSNHVFITEGRIQYLPDCWHQWRGQTVPCIPLSAADVDRYAAEYWPKADGVDEGTPSAPRVGADESPHRAEAKDVREGAA